MGLTSLDWTGGMCKTRGLARLGGLAAVLGGVLMVFIGVFVPAGLRALSDPGSTFGPIFHVLQYFAAMLFCVGLAGLYALLRSKRRAGLLAAVGLALAILASLGAALVVVHEATVGLVDPSGPFSLFETLAIIGYLGRIFLPSVSALLLGVRALKVRSLGAWRGLPLFLGAIMLAYQLSTLLLPGEAVFPGQPWGEIFLILGLPFFVFGLGVATLGLLLVRWGGGAAT